MPHLWAGAHTSGMEKPIWSDDQKSRRGFISIVAFFCLAIIVMYQFVPDAKPYFLALLVHTVTLLAGCAATVMLGILQKYVLKKPLSVKWELSLLAAFVFFAGFQAWQDQYRANTAAQKQWEEYSSPHLEGGFDTALDQRGKDVTATLEGVIWNSGATTSIVAWQLSLRFNDGREIYADLLRGPTPDATMTYKNQNGGPSVDYPGSRYWPSSDAPIVHGGKLPGWMMGLFHDVSKQEIVDKKATIILRYKDTAKHEWSTEEVLSKDKEYVPQTIPFGQSPPTEKKP